MLYIILYLFFSLLGLTLIKLGGNYQDWVFHISKINLKISYVSILGFISYIASFLIYTIIIIPRYELSYITAFLTGITQIIILLIAYFVFRENITIFKVLGILAIIIGIVLINIKK